MFLERKFWTFKCCWDLKDSGDLETHFTLWNDHKHLEDGGKMLWLECEVFPQVYVFEHLVPASGALWKAVKPVGSGPSLWEACSQTFTKDTERAARKGLWGPHIGLRKVLSPRDNSVIERTECFRADDHSEDRSHRKPGWEKPKPLRIRCIFFDK